MGEPRIDPDAPGPGIAYVLRLVAADGRGLKITASMKELDDKDVQRVLNAKAEMLVDCFLNPPGEDGGGVRVRVHRIDTCPMCGGEVRVEQ